MDPKACLQRAADALDSGDLDEAKAALADYRRWRQHGGFEPEGGDALASALQKRLRQRSA